MAIPVLILGESGTGHSASMRNCTPERFGIINVSRKPLPFRNNFKTYDTDNYEKIAAALKKCKTPSMVIDDSQYLMVNAFMRRFREVGFQKFVNIAQDHWKLVQLVVDEMPADRIVYFMSHIERDQNGNEHAKTVGKMIDQYITLEGLFTIVFKTNVQDGHYTFITRNNGFDTVKTPIGMFEETEIDNDLMAIDDIIRDYYQIGIEMEGDNNDQAAK